MQVQKTSTTSDILGRYYTSSLVGSILVNSMDVAQPEFVLDLGAGDGALTTAAAQRWQGATYYTVDIDKHAKSSTLPAKFGSAFRHHIGDALSASIEKKLGLKLGCADLALCNPPYIRPLWRNGFANILEDAGLSHVLPKLVDVPAAILFIAQNLRFLRESGRLGLIVPDGVIAGEKFSDLRHALASKYCIERVIELPRGIFKRTEAKAHICFYVSLLKALTKFMFKDLKKQDVCLRNCMCLGSGLHIGWIILFLAETLLLLTQDTSVLVR